MSKGSRDRTTNRTRYGENYDRIKWPHGSKSSPGRVTKKTRGASPQTSKETPNAGSQP